AAVRLGLLKMTPRPLWHILLFALPITLLAVIGPWLPMSQLKIFLVQSPLAFLVGVVITVLAAHLLLQSERPERCFSVALLGADQSRTASTPSLPDNAAAQRIAGEAQASRAGLIPVLGFVVVLAGIALLEAMQPFYFTQDDNLMQFLPVMLQGCHSLWHGVFPTWNPCQYLGSPTSSMGVYALTYPPTYVAYAVARYILGNQYLTLEVFCIGHILLGYWLTFRAIRIAGIGRWLSTAGSVAFVLSGFTLIAGRSWYYMVPVVVWLPLLVSSVERLRQGPVGRRWVLLTGLAIGVWFHAGNAQMWIYGVMFWFLAILVLSLSGEIPLQRVRWIAPAILLGLAIAAPLLVPQAQAVAHTLRYLGGDINIRPGLLGLLLPSSLFPAVDFALGGSTDRRYAGELFYSGTLFPAITLLGLASLAAFRWPRRIVARNPWLVLAGVAFLLALGEAGLIWSLMSLLPPFNKFEFAFKFLPFFNLFAVLAAGTIIERYLSAVAKRNSSAGRRWDVSLSLAVLVLLLYHCSLCKPSFYSYALQPYPPLSIEARGQVKMRDFLAGTRQVVDHLTTDDSGAASDTAAGSNNPQARIISFAPLRSIRPDYYLALQHNLPTVYDLLSIGGYDPLVEGSPENRALTDLLIKDPVSAAHAYGVKWMIEDSTLIEHPTLTNLNYHHLETMHGVRVDELYKLKQKTKEREPLRFGPVTLWNMGSEDPLAFREGAPADSLLVEMNASGAAIKFYGRKSPDRLVVNILRRPELKAWVDGHRVPITGDRWNRVVVDIPANAHFLEIRDCPDWRRGFIVAAVLLLLSAGFAALFRRRN
ncbi:MAG: YfhO family protein, partial [Armatimonadota bacterium]|nr:YfhO family protein [Armatimonadota bacterium]